MTADLPAQLRTRITESGKSLKLISREAGVGYFKFSRWYAGRTTKLDCRMADKLSVYFTGKGLSL